MGHPGDVVMLALVRLAARLALETGEPAFSVQSAADSEVRDAILRRLDPGPRATVRRPSPEEINHLKDQIERMLNEIGD